MQLARLLVVAAVLLVPAAARGDGTLEMRGIYYKEKATRVVQPMLDATFEVGDEGEADAHVLVDSITSASVAAGTTGEAFTERRWEVGGGYKGRVGESLTIGGSGRLSYEPDYQSFFVSGLVARDFAQQTRTLGLGVAVGQDRISNEGMVGGGPMSTRIEGDLTTLLASLSYTQVMSRAAVLGVTYDLIFLDGFQENPYRTAITADGLMPERHPDTRVRHAVAGLGRYFVDRTETTLIGSYRWAVDSWDVMAHTPEVRVVQEAGDGLDVSLRYRFHWQSAADFYLRSYPSSDPVEFPYLTDDVKLSRFTSHTVGMKIGAAGHRFGLGGRLEEARGELVLEYVDQNNRFGNAIIAHVGLLVPFED